MSPIIATPDEIEAEIARLDSEDAAKQRAVAEAEEARTQRLGHRRANALVRPAPLKEGRVGCIVLWSARDIFVNDEVLRDELRRAEVARDCPTCEALAGFRCVRADPDRPGDVIEADEPCAARSPALADLVREPVGPHTAMRRALARCQSGLDDGLRWYDCGCLSTGTGVDERSQLRVALATQTDEQGWERDADTNMAANVLATARWFVGVDDDGAVHLPDDKLLGKLGDRAALRSLLQRYRKEREYLTAPDVGQALVALFLSRLGGFRVKAGGAVYFVPAPADEVTDAIVEPFHKAGVYLRRIEVTTAAAAQFAESASESLEEEALHLLEDCRSAHAAVLAVMADPDKKGKPKLKATLDKLRKVDDIRRRATIYAQTLGAMTAEVERAAKEAESAISSVLSELTGGML